MRFKYIELRPTYGGTAYYHFPNENLTCLRELINDIPRAKRCLSICSAGEVPLTVMLPKSDEVVAIDHSYNSLKWAVLKALLLENFSTPDIFGLLQRKPDDVYKVFYELTGTLKEKKLHVTPDLALSKYGFEFGTMISLPKFVEMWKLIPAQLLDEARERLECVTFVHGDIRDAAKLGKFDLIYMSNAAEHSNHDSAVLGYNWVQNVADSEAMCVWAKAFMDPRYTPASFKLIKHLVSKDYKCCQPSEMVWTFHLGYKPSPERAATT